MDQQKSCSLKLAPKKKRGKDAHVFFSLIYLFAPFSIFYIPQAVPHAILQTHSAFYPHRFRQQFQFEERNFSSENSTLVYMDLLLSLRQFF